MLLLVLTHDQGTVFGLEQNEFAGLVFYSAWGIVAAAAFLPRRGQWGQALRNLVAWIAIVLVLVTGYMYRYELQDVAYRVTAGFVPGSPLHSVSADGREQITLLRIGEGQFNARGEVNGTPTGFVIDTGASVVVLSHGDAEAAGIRTSGLTYSVPVATANGRTTAARVNIDLDQDRDHRTARRDGARLPRGLARQQPARHELPDLALQFRSARRPAHPHRLGEDADDETVSHEQHEQAEADLERALWQRSAPRPRQAARPAASCGMTTAIISTLTKPSDSGGSPGAPQPAQM